MVCEVLVRLWAHHDEQYRQSGFMELPVGWERQAVKEAIQKKKKKKKTQKNKNQLDLSNRITEMK